MKNCRDKQGEYKERLGVEKQLPNESLHRSDSVARSRMSYVERSCESRSSNQLEDGTSSITNTLSRLSSQVRASVHQAWDKSKNHFRITRKRSLDFNEMKDFQRIQQGANQTEDSRLRENSPDANENYLQLQEYCIPSKSKDQSNCQDKSIPTNFNVVCEKQCCEVYTSIKNSIFDGNKERLDDFTTAEARHKMETRQNITEAVPCPHLWGKQRQTDFIVAVGNIKGKSLTTLEKELDPCFDTIVTKGTWNDAGYTHMPAILKEMKKHRKYNVASAVDLVRLLRNAITHCDDDESNQVGKYLLEDYVFLEYFPYLVPVLYGIIFKLGWDQTQLRIKHALAER